MDIGLNCAQAERKTLEAGGSCGDHDSEGRLAGAVRMELPLRLSPDGMVLAVGGGAAVG